MTFPLEPVFLGLLVAYLVYSAWARLDARYPVVAALLLLGAAAVADAVGASGSANVFAEYAFFLLIGGVVLLYLDHFRARRPAPDLGAASPPTGPAAEPTDERDLPPQQALDGPEQ